MIDSLIIEHDLLVKKRLEKFKLSKAAKEFSSVPLKSKILFVLFALLVIMWAIFTMAWIFSSSSKNYGMYSLYALVLSLSAGYSIYRNALDEVERKLYDNTLVYKKDVLLGLKNVLLKYDMFSRNKINVLINQCDSKIVNTQKFLKPLSLFLQIFFIPLLVASFQVFFTEKKTAVLYALLFAALGLMFYGILYLLAPVKNLFESENVKRLESLKKELQDILLFYFE